MEGANKEEGSLKEMEKMKGSSSESDAAKEGESETTPFSNTTRVSLLGDSKEKRRDEPLTGNHQFSDKKQEASDNETKPSPMKVVKNGSSDPSGDKIPAKDKSNPGDQTENLVLQKRPDPENNCCDKYCPKCCAEYCCIL